MNYSTEGTMSLEQKYLVFSDIHGNLSAFDAVLKDSENESPEGVILLGDCIDYGMRSNDIIQRLIDLETSAWREKIIVNIWGNHEKLVLDKDYERLSSDRGRAVAAHTAKALTMETLQYIKRRMNNSGMQEFLLNKMNCFAVHGSLEDYYWKSIEPNNLRGNYRNYDIVFGGHSHLSHCFTYFYSSDDERLRNKKAVLFINPGSVGQPRNHNPYAQYAVLYLPSKRVELRAVKYDIQFEQSLYPESIDPFYKERLSVGV